MAPTEPASAEPAWHIAEVPTTDGTGRIGLASAPGNRHTRAPDRMEAWNAALVVSLVEPHELEALGIPRLGAEVRRRHMEWHHWPIGDHAVPDETLKAAWPAHSAILLAANLGDDADTTAAIAGQFAGAIHGLSGIPQDWYRALAWRERIENVADSLFAERISEAPSAAFLATARRWRKALRFSALPHQQPMQRLGKCPDAQHADRPYPDEPEQLARHQW